MTRLDFRNDNAGFLARWLGPFLIVLVGVVDAWWTWRTWPDVLVDFGGELYAPWQLVAGKTFYTDILYFKGPLSPYLNALWFRFFGVSVTTLEFCNLAIACGILCLLYQILLSISDRLSATIGCILFLLLFAFAQFVPIGNYNFVCPYSHESTHGIALSLTGLWCLRVYLKHRRLWPIACAGMALGLVFLTRAEMFVAAGLAMATGLGLILWCERTEPARVIRMAGLFVGGVLIPPAIGFALLCLKLSPSQALTGVLSGWLPAFDRKITSLKFYRDLTGTSNIPGNLEEMLGWLGRYAVVFGLVAVVALILPRRSGHWRWFFPVMPALVAGLLAMNWRAIVLSAARPLPLLVLGMGLASAVEFVGKRRKSQETTSLIVRLSLLVFAFGLLGKIFLNVHLSRYGFALAMPATLMMVTALLCWIPAAIEARGGPGGVFRAAGLAALAVTVVSFLHVQQGHVSRKTYRVSQGADSILAGLRGPMVDATLAAISSRIKSNETLTALPEGVMLNFLSRRSSSVPLMNFMPMEFALYGEDRILESFRAHPPDYIALVHKDTTEFGFRFFGQDYGQKVFAWVRQNYHPVELIGSPPLRDDKFGILLLGRNQQKIRGSDG